MPSRARKVIRRQQRAARDQQQIYGLKAVRVPMAQQVQIQNPLPGMTVPVAASPAEGVIYSDGAMNRYTAAHESAHLLEKYMTEQDKKRFTRAMGMPNRPWEIGDPGTLGHQSDGYRRSAGELFADYVAMLATDHDPQGNKVIAAYANTPPSRKKLLRLGRSLERFGARYGLPEYVRPRRNKSA